MMCGATVSEPTVPSSRMCPSGAALATKSVAILPPAPALFSTRTCWPRLSPRFFCMMRATVSVPPPGANPTTIVTGRAGNVLCANAPPAQDSARRAAEILFMIFPPWWSPSLFSLEHRLSFLHEGAPALDVVLTVEALLDQRRARLRVERRTRLQQLADDALARPDGERRVLRNRRAILAHERFQLGDRRDAVHEAHDLGLFGAEMAPRDQHLAGVRGPHRVHEVLQRRGPVAEPEFRGGDAEPRVLRGEAQVAIERDVHARAQAVAADHRDGHLVAALQALLHSAGDLLVILDALGARALLLVLRDIRPGDERLVAVAFQDDHAYLRVPFEAVEHLRNPFPHVDRDGVAPRRVVECEPADRALLFGDDALGERAGREGGLARGSLQFFLVHGRVSLGIKALAL